MLRRIVSIVAKYWKTLAVVIFSFAVVWAALQGYSSAWTGFADFTKPNSDFVRGKTLWDWMELFIIPIFLAIGAFYLNRSDREIERQRAEERARLEREIATDRQQEVALQSYLDRMADLLLGDSSIVGIEKVNEQVRNVARIRTLTVLRGLDGKRKGIVLLFLHESGLITEKPVIDLTGADLRGIFLKEAHLSGARLGEVDLTGADLTKAILSEADLSGANLVNANLSQANLQQANLTGTNLGKADLSFSSLRGIVLTKANLSEADLSRANLIDANLSNANLSGANLQQAPLSGANLNGASLSRADLSNADLRRANLGGASLSRADLSGADLSRTDLSGSNLSEANLTGADLTEADLTQAGVSKKQLATAKSLKGAIMPDGTKYE